MQKRSINSLLYMCVLYTYFYGKCYSSSSIWRPASFTFFSASFSCSLDKLMPVYLHPVRLTTSIAKLPQQHGNTQSQEFHASLQFLPKFIGKALFSSQTNARPGWHIFREKFFFFLITLLDDPGDQYSVVILPIII